MIAFVFPGQGTQRTGMGGWFRTASPAAIEVYERGSAVLGRDVTALCQNASDEELRSTTNAQVALYVTNAAALAVLTERGIDADLVAGHSVGELSALHAAGSLSFEDGLRAVGQRAAIMAEHGRPGAMLAVHGLDAATAGAVVGEVAASRVLTVALQNGPYDVVCSGDAAAVDALADRLRGERGVRTALVRTSHAFHCPLMSDAAGPWADVVRRLPLARPRLPVALNVTGRLSTSVAEIEQALVAQLDQQVRWAACTDALVDAGARTIVEVGDSKVLSSYLRSRDDGTTVVALGLPRAVARLQHLAGV